MFCSNFYLKIECGVGELCNKFYALVICGKSCSSQIAVPGRNLCIIGSAKLFLMHTYLPRFGPQVMLISNSMTFVIKNSVANKGIHGLKSIMQILLFPPRVSKKLDMLRLLIHARFSAQLQKA